MREIWGIGTPRSFRPIWVCEELGLDYQHHAIGPRTGETQQPEFTALNRKQKIPFYRDERVSLSESVAICRYLTHNFSDGQVSVPDSPEAFAKEDEWCAYIYGEIDETGLYVMRRHSDLGSIYGESPEVSAAAASYVSRHFEVVADRLADDNTLMTSGFGLADVLLMRLPRLGDCLWGRFTASITGVLRLPQHAACLSARDENQLSRLIWG